MFLPKVDLNNHPQMFHLACIQLRRRIFHQIHGTDGGQSVICTTKQKKSCEIEQNQFKWLKKRQPLEKGQHILDDVLVKLITYFQRGIEVRAHILEPLQNTILAKKLSCFWNRKCPTFINFRLFSRAMFLIKGRYIYYFFGTCTSTTWLPLLNKLRLCLKIDWSKIIFRVYILDLINSNQIKKKDSHTLRKSLLKWCHLVSISKNVVFYISLLVRIY